MCVCMYVGLCAGHNVSVFNYSCPFIAVARRVPSAPCSAVAANGAAGLYCNANMKIASDCRRSRNDELVLRVGVKISFGVQVVYSLRGTPLMLCSRTTTTTMQSVFLDRIPLLSIFTFSRHRQNTRKLLKRRRKLSHRDKRSMFSDSLSV